MKRIPSILIAALFFISCQASKNADSHTNVKQEEALSLWNDGEARSSIISFVAEITDQSGSHYMAPEDRVVVFDMDGTILAERPMYALFDYAIQKINEQIADNPELAKEQPYKAISENDLGYFGTVGYFDDNGLYSVILYANDGDTEEEYNKQVTAYFETTTNKRFGVSNKQLVYAPVVQLIEYLQHNQFEVYLSTGSDVQFARAVCKDQIDIPPQNIIGTMVLTKMENSASGIKLVRQHEFVQPINDEAGKPVNIKNKIGKQPIMIVGNSMGDYHMLEYSKEASYSLQMIVNHDDDEREHVYNSDEMEEACEQNGWQVISMKNDFKEVFQFKE